MKIFDNPASRNANILAALMICGFLAACAAVDTSADAPDADTLLGTWAVDLRPTPDSDPYYQEFVVTSVAANTFSGTFYGAPISQGRINTDWGKLRIAFVTTDGSGAYNHSAVLEGDMLEGLSNSTGRDFLSYWSAVKE